LPLYRRETKGYSVQRGKSYEPTDNDEVEDLYNLLAEVKETENIEAVASGAILSDYQRVRVENVCQRLNLVSLAYLWRRDQSELLQEMIDCKIDAIIIKVAALGLKVNHLGKNIAEMKPLLAKMKEKYKLNVCGEGGEYETFTLDCPLFKQCVDVEDMQVVISSADPICPVGYINFTKLKLAPKPIETQDIRPKTSLDFLKNLSNLDEENLVASDDEGGTNPPAVVEEGEAPSEDNQHSEHLVAVQNRSCVVENNRGWLWVAGLQSSNTCPSAATTELLTRLGELLATHNCTLRSLVRITLFISDMTKYAEINAAYIGIINFQNPPTRVCVECAMPAGCQLIIEAIAHRSEDESVCPRQTLHVQSISHWAPANIGPYSQSIKVGSITYVSGQIALVPGTMQIVDGGITTQAQLVLRHIDRVLDANQVKRKLRDVVQGICYVTKRSHISAARTEWESKTANAIMDYVIVTRLPRDALIELQIWAHTYNDKFEYEETGCSIGDFCISLKKRWNYESECVAAICTVGTYISSPTTPTTPTAAMPAPTFDVELKTSGHEMSSEQLYQVLEYLIRKMLPVTTSPTETLPEPNRKPTAVHIRVFYHILKAPQFLYDVTEAFRQNMTNVQIIFSIIPVSGLQRENDFISIVAIKHE